MEEIDYKEAYEKEHIKCADLAGRIADLEEQENIAKEHLLEAACYRPSGEYWG